jgi:hypothetical protein
LAQVKARGGAAATLEGGVQGPLGNAKGGADVVHGEPSGAAVFHKLLGGGDEAEAALRPEARPGRPAS